MIQFHTAHWNESLKEWVKTGKAYFAKNSVVGVLEDERDGKMATTLLFGAAHVTVYETPTEVFEKLSLTVA